MQPEFLSGEASASPAVEPLLAGARAFADAGLARGALSARNGPRTTTHADVALRQLSAMDFLEVADYDARLDRLLCIGRREPHPQAPLHHLMMRAKKEIGAIVALEVGDRALAEPVPEAAPGQKPLDDAFAVLERLREADAVRLGDWLVVVAPSVRGALSRARALVGVHA